jgi:probable rRNA maturation factor
VLIRNNQRKIVDPRRLERAAKASLLVEGFDRPVEISILLVDDEEIQEFNKEYRDSDRPTDVLSFSQLEGDSIPSEEGTGLFPLGDIIISVDTAEAQAAEVGHSLDDEMDLLVVHGVLHLLGQDDKTPETAAVMRGKEKAVLGSIDYGTTD